MNSAISNLACGVINLNKPEGMTSRTAVDRVVRMVGRGVKVGHAGTLDPLASGVLVVCLGPATRLIEYVQRQSKTYRTMVLLGSVSDTLDADGTVTAVAEARPADINTVRAAVATQVGTFLQRPPEFSALKVQGRRAYDLARAGQSVELAPRPVTIHAIEILSYEWPRLELEVVCEGGTYIRSIARDVGEFLMCGGLVEVLVRTRIGSFSLRDAVELESLSAETIASAIQPPIVALGRLPSARLSEEQLADVAKGRPVRLIAEFSGEVAMIAPDGALAAVGEADAKSGWIAPRRVLIGG
jgi:tRNA pseudouridine55 synthase